MIPVDTLDCRRATPASKKTSSTENNDRACSICGDRANGFNFGVLTCESCKAFFRRNAAKKLEIKCPFANSCEITAASRKYCQACRLQKCFQLGMNSDWLTTDLKPKKQKLVSKRKSSKFLDPDDDNDDNEESDCVSVSKKYLQQLLKQAKQKDCCVCTCICGFYPSGTRLTSTTTVTQSPPSLEKSPMTSSISSPYPSPQIPTASYLSPQVYTPTLSAFQVPYSWSSSTNFQLRPYESSAFHTVTSPMDLPISTVEEAKQQLAKTKTLKYLPILTQEEREMLEELHILNEPLNAPLDQNYSSDSLHAIIRIVEVALRRIISMASRLKAFQELDIEDRKQLVKSGFCELLIVRGVMAYNKTNNSWNHNFATKQMEVKLDVLKKEPRAMEHYEMHKKLLESFSDEIRSNENIMLIFNAIVIFHPHVSDLRDSAKVHATQAKYFALLLKVLSFDFTQEKANNYYEKLLDLVVDLHRVNQTMLHIFYGLDPMQLDPLVRELCNFT